MLSNKLCQCTQRLLRGRFAAHCSTFTPCPSHRHWTARTRPADQRAAPTPRGRGASRRSSGGGESFERRERSPPTQQPPELLLCTSVSAVAAAAVAAASSFRCPRCFDSLRPLAAAPRNTAAPARPPEQLLCASAAAAVASAAWLLRHPPDHPGRAVRAQTVHAPRGLRWPRPTHHHALATRGADGALRGAG
jgi:hypothetical protein